MNDNCNKNNQIQNSLVPYEWIFFFFLILLLSETEIWKESFQEEYRKMYCVSFRSFKLSQSNGNERKKYIYVNSKEINVLPLYTRKH